MFLKKTWYVTHRSVSPDRVEEQSKARVKEMASASDWRSPTTCEFRAGLLDILANDGPERRSQAFHYLLKNTLTKQD
jgi:hypothetical protein